MKNKLFLLVERNHPKPMQFKNSKTNFRIITTFYYTFAPWVDATRKNILKD